MECGNRGVPHNSAQAVSLQAVNGESMKSARKHELRGTAVGIGAGALVGAVVGGGMGIAMFGGAIAGTIPLAIVLAITGGLAGNRIGLGLDRRNQRG